VLTILGSSTKVPLSIQLLSEADYINLDEKKLKILEWLSSSDMYNKQEDIYAKRHENTGKWIFDNTIFRNWVDGNGTQSTLWCPGNRRYRPLPKAAANI